MQDEKCHSLLSLLQHKLGLSDEGKQQAATAFEECLNILKHGTDAETFLQAQNDDETQRAAVVWIIRWLFYGKGGGRLPLSDILSCAGTNLVNFFREVPVVLARLRPFLALAAGDRATSIEQGLRLRENQETLLSLTILAKKYKDLFWRVHKTAAVPQAQALQAGWLTFLLLKAQLLQQFPDLVSCLQLLVSVLGCYVASMPYGEAEVRAMMEQNPAAIDAGGKLNTLKLLAGAARTDYAQVQALMPTVEQRFRGLLQAGQFVWLPSDLSAPAPPQPAAAFVSPICTLRVPAMLLERSHLSELVLYLDGSYQAEYERAGEIDEREFLTTDFGALASPRGVVGASVSAALAAGAGVPANGGGAPAGGYSNGLVPHGGQSGAPMVTAKPPLAPPAGLRRGLTLGLQSPLPIMYLGPPAPATPITQAMGSVAWLRGMTKDCTVDPSTALQQLMASAGPDVGSVLVWRVQEAADAVFGTASRPADSMQAPATAAAGAATTAALVAGGTAAGQPPPTIVSRHIIQELAVAAEGPAPCPLPSLHASVARERREEGIKLYWHALEAMLQAEKARAGPAGAAALVTRWSFHSCLLALSFEMVASSYRMGALCFPEIPERLGLRPFDLTKIIPAFVRALPTMPRELKHHLFTVEEKVVESLGWQASSSLYKVLAAAVGGELGQGQKSAGEELGGDADPVLTHALKPDAEEEASEAQNRAEPQQQQDTNGADQRKEPERPSPDAGDAAPMEADSGSGALGGSQLAPSTSGSHSAGGAADAAQAQSADEPSSKRRRGEGGAPVPSAGRGRSPQPDAAPELPQALGVPPDGPGAPAPAGSDPAARAVMFDFCRKVLKLAAFRLVAISEGLDFTPMERDDVLAAVHDVVSHALYQQTHLFYGRHLDQILLAALYGYCKVNRLGSITFKEIISHYRRQPHAKQEVFRTVVLRRAEPTLVTLESGDIIAFYNRVFVPAMKTHLLRRCIGSSPTGTGLGGSPEAGAGAAAVPAGSGGSSGVSAANAIAKHLHPGHINRSPIFAALQHAAAQQQQQQAAALPGGVIVKRSVGARPQVQSGPSGGTAYRTLSLDSSSTLGGLGLGFGGGHTFAGAGGGGGSVPNDSSGGSGGAPGLAALAAAAADGSGPAARGPAPASKMGHHVARAYVPSRLGRSGGLNVGSGGLASSGAASGGGGSMMPKGPAGPQWSGAAGVQASAAFNGAPSPTRRGARVTSPRGPLLVGAPAPVASADVAQCQDQSDAANGGAGSALGGSDAAAGGAALSAPRAAAAGSGSPYSAARASPSSVRRVGAKRQPHGSALFNGAGGGGAGATPSGLATLLQALESTTAMELDSNGGAAAGGAAAGGAAPETASKKEAAAVGQASQAFGVVAPGSAARPYLL